MTGTWNYRVINHGDHLALHEVHYDQTGKPVAYTESPASFVADPEEGLPGITGALARALSDALNRPVLKVEEFST